MSMTREWPASEGKVVVASLVGIIEKAVELEELGIAQEDIVRLQ